MNEAKHTPGPHFARGDLVQTWFDTGAGKMGGARLLYGEVIAVGAKTALVRWESGLTCRVRQSAHNVEPASDQDDARAAIARATGA